MEALRSAIPATQSVRRKPEMRRPMAFQPSKERMLTTKIQTTGAK
jgi:hypothetical protein